MKNKLEPISIQMELMRISAKRSVIVANEQIFKIKQNIKINKQNDLRLKGRFQRNKTFINKYRIIYWQTGKYHQS